MNFEAKAYDSDGKEIENLDGKLIITNGKEACFVETEQYEAKLTYREIEDHEALPDRLKEKIKFMKQWL